MKMAYLVLGVAIALAAVFAYEGYQSAASMSVEEAQAHVQRSYPNLKVEKVMPTKLNGFHAVVASGRVYYLSSDGAFLMAGILHDLEADVNLTELAKADLRKEVIANIRQEQLLSYAPDEQKHVVRVFSDVNCPYCRKLHGELGRLTKQGVRVDYIVVPFLGEEAVRNAKKVWCSADRHAAMDAGMTGRPVEAEENCDTPIQDNLNLARSLGVRATPAFLFEDGRLIVGYRPVPDLIYELKNPPQS